MGVCCKINNELNETIFPLPNKPNSIKSEVEKKIGENMNKPTELLPKDIVESMNHKSIESKIETIKFGVETYLSKPTELLHKNTAESIIKEKSYFSDEREVFTYEFDTNEKEFYNCGKKSLIWGLIEAYKNHYPITISPDMIWLMILQVLSKFLDKYHEKLRYKFVNFDNQKTLEVERTDLNPYTAKKEDWRNIFQEYTEKIGENIGLDTLKSLTPNFTSTSPVVSTTGQVTIMSIMKHYFKYSCSIYITCGIREIELEGSIEDWEKLLIKTKNLENYDLNWWTKEIIPLIEKIIYTKKYFTQNKCINEEIVDFWKNIIIFHEDQLDGLCGHISQDYINGWIVKFFPSIERLEVLNELYCDSFDDQILNCPMKLTITDNSITTTYNCSIESGFYGMSQDPNTFTIKPVIGYALVVENK